jgi:glycosyltransferase involved in cell wall biosynthesis
MPDSPLVSVVTTAYNVAPYIRESVVSALEQTYPHVELIVVDDGSTDATIKQIEDFRDPRLQVIEQRHAGQVAALNAGVRAAKGDYIGFLDGDDVWRPENLQRHMAFHTHHPEADLTFSLSGTIEADGSIIGSPVAPHRGPVSFRDLLVENVVRNGSAAVVRAEALRRAGPFDAELVSCYDLDMWLRIARLRPGNIHCIPEVLAFYRRRPHQITADWRRMQEGWGQVMAKMERLAPDDVRATRSAHLGNLYRYLAYLAYENRDYSTAIGLLAKGYRASAATFCLDSRNLLLAAAIISGWLLPENAHDKLQRFARRRRAVPPPPSAGNQAGFTD